MTSIYKSTCGETGVNFLSFSKRSVSVLSIQSVVSLIWCCLSHKLHKMSKKHYNSISTRWWAVMTSQSSGEPLIWLSAPPRRPPELLGGLWQLWLQQRNINGWPCLTLKRRTGSSFWMPRLRLLTCSATPSMSSSTGTRRPINKRWLFSGSCLAALQLRRLLDGSSPSRVLAPRTGRCKNWASPFALPRVRPEDELQAKKSSAKKPWCPWPRACEGSPLWGRATFIAVHGARSSSVPSGDRSANPATYSAPGCSDLQQAHILVSSARKRSGTEMLATPSGVSRAASLAVSCRYATPGHRTSCSNNTRGQSQETGSLSRLFSSLETTAKCVLVGPAHCRERLQNPVWFSATSVQPGDSHSGGSWVGSGNETRSKYSLEEGGLLTKGGPGSTAGTS